MTPINSGLDEPKEDIYHELITKKGEKHQIEKFIEECEEAIEAGQAYLQNMDDDRLESEFLAEVADVKITGEQLPMIFTAEKCNKHYFSKLKRLQFRLRRNIL